MLKLVDMTLQRVVVASLLAVWMLSGVTSQLGDVKLGVILPYSGPNPWVLPKVLPAVQYALETVAKRRWLPGRRLLINTADSKCSETEGPLAAIDMYINNSANVFLGPACNYAIAPVARFSHRWGIPVLTSGALVRAFRDKTEYRLLTRILGTYGKCAHFFITTFRQMGWTKAGLLFHDKDATNANAGKSECFFSMEGVYEGFKNTFPMPPWFKRFDQRLDHTDYKKLLVEAALNARSKSL